MNILFVLEYYFITSQEASNMVIKLPSSLNRKVKIFIENYKYSSKNKKTKPSTTLLSRDNTSINCGTEFSAFGGPGPKCPQSTHLREPPLQGNAPIFPMARPNAEQATGRLPLPSSPQLIIGSMKTAPTHPIKQTNPRGCVIQEGIIISQRRIWKLVGRHFLLRAFNNFLQPTLARPPRIWKNSSTWPFLESPGDCTAHLQAALLPGASTE